MSAEHLPTPPRPSRRSGSNTRRRQRIFPFRATAEEAEQIERLCESRGLSPGALVRETLLAIPAPPARRVSSDHQAIGRLLAEIGAVKGELGKAGSNLNQIAHHLNAGRDPFVERTALAIEAAAEENRRALDRLGEMWQALMELAGRR